MARASVTSATAIWTPPTTTRVGRGRRTSTKRSHSPARLRAGRPFSRAARVASRAACPTDPSSVPTISPFSPRSRRVPSPGPAITVVVATGSSLANASRTAAKTRGSRGSTNTSIVPPQARPTAHAVSSATPKWSSRGGAPCSTSRAACTTAASTQPPLTEPARPPSSLDRHPRPRGAGGGSPRRDHGREGDLALGAEPGRNRLPGCPASGHLFRA